MYNGIQVLIATMNRKDISFMDKMNIQSSVVVGNQNGVVDYKQFIYNDKTVDFYCSDKHGSSNNRNLTLNNAYEDICIIADDDLVYVDGYEWIIKKAFENNPHADVVIFNIYENPIKRYVIKHKFKVNFTNYMRFGAVRIAFKRNSILKNKIKFDTRFGPGSIFSSGEDTIFLKDCLRAGLKIIAVPEYILTLTNERESTWFNGYDKKYLHDKGALFAALSRRFSILICLQTLIRHPYIYRKQKIGIYEALKIMKSGAVHFRDIQYNTNIK